MRDYGWSWEKSFRVALIFEPYFCKPIFSEGQGRVLIGLGFCSDHFTVTTTVAEKTVLNCQIIDC